MKLKSKSGKVIEIDDEFEESEVIEQDDEEEESGKSKDEKGKELREKLKKGELVPASESTMHATYEALLENNKLTRELLGKKGEGDKKKETRRLFSRRK